MKDKTWGELPIPNIYRELEGEFIHFDIDFEEMQYGDWIKDFYQNNKFSL